MGKEVLLLRHNNNAIMRHLEEYQNRHREVRFDFPVENWCMIN